MVYTESMTTTAYATPAYEVISTNPVTGATATFAFTSYDAAGRALCRLLIAGQDAWLDDGQDYEGPTCSLCDALGHGYPGGPPCPLEDRGRCECGGQQASDGSGCLCGGS
jgi:hypothetical protein